MALVKVYNPIGVVQDMGVVIVDRPKTLNGRVIGFIDDMKPNAGPFLKFIESYITNEFLIPSTYTVRKSLTPNMAIAHELDPSVTAAVVAWGD